METINWYLWQADDLTMRRILQRLREQGEKNDDMEKLTLLNNMYNWMAGAKLDEESFYKYVNYAHIWENHVYGRVYYNDKIYDVFSHKDMVNYFKDGEGEGHFWNGMEKDYGMIGITSFQADYFISAPIYNKRYNTTFQIKEKGRWFR